MKKPIAIDLFCGAGGMSEGILQAGFHIIYSNDKSEQAIQTYTNRHKQLGLIPNVNTLIECEDISNISGVSICSKINQLPKKEFHNCHIDAIFGGPPCQGFSRAGLRNHNDPRNFLFREYIRIISEISPSYIVFENVVGILDSKLYNYISHDNETYSGENLVTYIIERELQKIGYTIIDHSTGDPVAVFKSLVVNAAEYGVPQIRERVIIIAYKSQIARKPDLLINYKSTNIITTKEAIADLIFDKEKREIVLNNLQNIKYIKDSQNGRIIKNSFKELKNNDLSKHQSHIHQRFLLYKQGENSNTLRKRLNTFGFTKLELGSIPDLLKYVFEQLKSRLLYSNYSEFIIDIQNITTINYEKRDLILDLILSKKSQRTRLDADSPSRTIMTIADDFISPFEDRVLTVREMARLQSFDDSFEFLGKRTTGGDRRRFETPQQTQVGNAVPPLLAKAIASSIIHSLIS